jgi:hypothetical protein
MRWAGQVACMGEMRNACKIWLESMKRGDNSEELGVDWRLILE